MLNQLVQLCQQRKPEAERELFARFAPRVWTICRRYAACDPDAQDYLQECFLCVFNNIQKYDPNKGPFEAWLYRLCTNTILQLLRKAKSRLNIVLLEDLPDGEEIEEPMIEQISTELVIAAIQQLPQGYRQVLNLYVFEEWTHREIALELNISESASRSQLARARKFLKTVLKKLKPSNYEKRSA